MGSRGIVKSGNTGPSEAHIHTSLTISSLEHVTFPKTLILCGERVALGGGNASTGGGETLKAELNTLFANPLMLDPWKLPAPFAATQLHPLNAM